MEITTPRISSPMRCAAHAKVDPTALAMTPTMALEMSLETNVTGTMLSQNHAEASIPKTSRQMTCAAYVVVVTNQLESGTSQPLKNMSSSI